MKLTANHVTLTRIVLLPIPVGLLLYNDRAIMWVAFVVGCALGVTDFIDGYMARRDGPTTLGALLDPTADKLFVACFFLPLTAMGLCPWWLTASIFTRELLITALRSSMALRDEKLQTSVLAKTKTIAQMGGLGVFFFIHYTPRLVMLWVNGIGAAAFALAFVYFLIKRKGKAPPYYVTSVTVLWLPVAVSLFYLEPKTAMLVLFVIMAILTVASGLDYMVGAAKVFKAEGLTSPDVTRLLWALAHGIGSMWVVAAFPAAVIPVMLSLSAELCFGGIDNIVTAEESRPPKGSFFVTGLVAFALAIMVIFFDGMKRTDPIVWMAMVLAAASIGNAVRAFASDWEVFKRADMPKNPDAADD